MMMGPQGMMGGMGEHMGAMMGDAARVMAFSPGHLISHKDVLKLTDQQVSRLTALRDAARTAGDAAKKEADTHRHELMDLMAGANPDTAALKPHFQAMHAAMGKAHWAMLTAAAQARGVLTDVQRARVEGWADAMQHMGGMGPGMGMMHHGDHDGMGHEGHEWHEHPDSDHH